MYTYIQWKNSAPLQFEYSPYFQPSLETALEAIYLDKANKLVQTVKFLC